MNLQSDSSSCVALRFGIFTKTIAEQWGKAEGNGKSKTVRDYAEQRALELLNWIWRKNDFLIVPRKEFVEAFENLEDAYNNGDNDMVEYYIVKIHEAVDGKEEEE